MIPTKSYNIRGILFISGMFKLSQISPVKIYLIPDIEQNIAHLQLNPDCPPTSYA